ncbi:hypothetical protein [Agrobacterium sp.]|jgi:hypothetical protein|uniref:hypothetical protein n=1 Tax=Agrobacterium sp. TaxID=361 RepID=UPI0028A8F261|nr:hypothetical protein [Agrobacterium sp.]
MQLIDTNHPIYRPLWVRLLIVVSCTAWSLIEFFITQDAFWGTIVGGVAAYSAYMLLFTFKPAPLVEQKPAVATDDDAND